MPEQGGAVGEDAATQQAERASRMLLIREAIAGVFIVGLLLAIVVPVYLDQVKKAHDDEAEAAALTVANAIKDALGVTGELPELTFGVNTVVVGESSVHSIAPGVEVTGPTGDTTDWCVWATHPKGDRAVVEGYQFSSEDDEVKEGNCEP